MNSRSGKYKTNLTGEMAYNSFVPSPLPPNPPLKIDNAMIALLIKANKQLALLESLSVHIPNINLFISMYVRKEALMSSQIEGTQATLEDILDPSIGENTNRDVSDVINYVKATNFAINRLEELPLCNRLIRESHAVLMQNVRGQAKEPGNFRHTQNWIGGQNSALQNASFIPPSPEDMIMAMSYLERYMNSDDELDVLIRAGLIHYQFETIHPFLDGNGRIGRLLIMLFIMQKGLLTSPVIYISYYLKRNRIEYYDRMTEVRASGNFEQWVRFFLQAVYESAEDATKTINMLTVLHDKNLAVIRGMGRGAKTAERLFAYLEENPIIEIQKTAAILEVSFNTVSSAVERLCNAGILTCSANERRNRNFIYGAYVDILRNGTV